MPRARLSTGLCAQPDDQVPHRRAASAGAGASIREPWLSGRAREPDLAIWRHAARTGAIIVTKDEDFVALARRESHGPQVARIRLGNISNEALWRAIEPQLDEIIEALEAGERIVEVL